MNATIELFKALPIGNGKGLNETEKQFIFAQTIKKGFVFGPTVLQTYSFLELKNLIPIIEKSVGIDAKHANASFHKSWDKVANSPIEVLVYEQLIHYFTTYGFEALGIYNESSVYVPREKLDIPELETDIPLTIIRAYTKEQLISKLMHILSSGIALKDKTKDNAIDLFINLGLDESCLAKVKNKETKIALYDYFGWVPSNPIEFVRYIVYKAIGSTLLVKNPATIYIIKHAPDRNMPILPFFKKYEDSYGLETLSQVFNRFKPIFLSFKTNQNLSTYINKLNKMSKWNHKPMLVDFMNTVTCKIKRKDLDFAQLEKELGKVNIFRKVKLLQALNNRTLDILNIMYSIRNGKMFVKPCDPFIDNKLYHGAIQIVMDSIAKGITKNLTIKKIYIPNYIQYALPNSEKQFVGNIPFGSYVSVPNNMVFGVHWFNLPKTKVDLDLSMIDCSGTKVGWNAYYRTSECNILFSGDITDAPKPNGASELFYISKNVETYAMVNLNYFNGNWGGRGNQPVDFKLFIGQDQIGQLTKNYMIDPNKILTTQVNSIDKHQKYIGLVTVDSSGCRFYYVDGMIGGSAVARRSKVSKAAMDFTFKTFSKNITLNQILLRVPGLEFVGTKDECELDLSPEALEKDTLLKLMVGE